MRKTTQEEFEKRCIEIYGDRFKFNETVYKNNRTKVTLFDTMSNEYIKVLPENIYKGKIRTKNKKYTTKNVIKWSKEIFGDKYKYDKCSCSNSHDKITITCPIHGDFIKEAYAHIDGKQGCPKCSLNFRTKKMFIDDARKVHGNKYDYSLVKDALPNMKVDIVCNIHGVFQKTPYEHITKRIGCPKCSLELRKKDLASFIIDSNLDKRNIEIIGDYKSMAEKCKFRCKICGYEWEATPTKIQCGRGCPKCGKNIKPTNEEIIKQFIEVHGTKYDYSLVDMESAKHENHYKVKIICPEHGIFEQSYNHHLNGVGCPLCHESKLERKTRLMLENNSIKYVAYWKTDGLKNVLPLSLDFYLPEYNVAIECQGKFHFEPINALGGVNAYNKQHENDVIKNQFCKNEDIKLLYYSEENYDDFLGEKLYKTTDELLNEIRPTTQ